jgi:Mn2+/Fe2+ NRAMP family transporter
MLNDKQSLILTGLMVASIFVFGILKILDNFIVLTILTIMFFAIVINIFYSKTKAEETLKEVPIQNKKVF